LFSQTCLFKAPTSNAPLLTKAIVASWLPLKPAFPPLKCLISTPAWFKKYSGINLPEVEFSEPKVNLKFFSFLSPLMFEIELSSKFLFTIKTLLNSLSISLWAMTIELGVCSLAWTPDKPPNQTKSKSLVLNPVTAAT